jgi:hypothetical protein
MPLGKLYYDSKLPVAFGSEAKLVKASKNEKREVEEWLSSQNTYTLHKRVRKNYPRHPYNVTNIDVVWEMGFANLSSHSKYNDNLLNVLDIFSWYGSSELLKNKIAT